MPLYRFYYVDQFGHIFGRSECEAEEDLAALDAAERFADRHGVEIWCEERFVTRIKQGGEADIDAIEAPHETPPPGHAP
jgi:hypothetical protein